MTRRTLLGLPPFALAFALVFAAGCGDGKAKFYPVTGKVTFKGSAPVGARLTSLDGGFKDGVRIGDGLQAAVLLGAGIADQGGHALQLALLCRTFAIENSQLRPKVKYAEYAEYLTRGQ